jgi:hypothetical protein
VHQQVSAAGRGRDDIHVQLLQFRVRAAFGQREIQRALHLPAQLAGLVLGAPAGRAPVIIRPGQCRREIRVDMGWGSTPIVLAQDKSSRYGARLRASADE